MTLITAFIKPNREGPVVSALHDLPEFPGFSLTEAKVADAAQAESIALPNMTSPICGTFSCRSPVNPTQRPVSAPRLRTRHGQAEKVTA
jgi:hypothetical protein